MGRGAEQQELGIAIAQIRAASAEAAGKNGVAQVVRNNGGELSDRAAGAIGGLLVVVATASLATDYATTVVAGCAAIALGLIGYVVLKHRQVNTFREQQVRQLALKNTQEDGNA